MAELSELTMTVEFRKPWHVKIILLYLVLLWLLGIRTPGLVNGWVAGLCLWRIDHETKWRRLGKRYAHSTLSAVEVPGAEGG